MAKKYYVVWEGRETGVFDNWNVVKKLVQGVAARYKSFPSLEQANTAYQGNPGDYIGKDVKPIPGAGLSADELKRIGKPIENSIAVDAACSGVPGPVEYQGVYVGSNQLLFRKGPYVDGTNNIGEFLALVHALAWLKQQKLDLPIYSDSRTAISWVKKKKCNSKHVRSAKNKEIYDLVDRADKWLSSNTWSNKILKWETKVWGEIPADFGRK